MLNTKIPIIKIIPLLVGLLAYSCGVERPQTNYFGTNSEDALPSDINGVFVHENFGISPCESGILTIAFTTRNSCFFSWTTEDSSCDPVYRGNVCKYDSVDSYLTLSEQDQSDENSIWQLKREVSFRNNQLIIKGQSGYIFLDKITETSKLW